MKKIKVSEATNTQLDWLVAKCEGMHIQVWPARKGLRKQPEVSVYHPNTEWGKFHPTTNPAQMWPIIENMVSDGFELKQAVFSAAFQCIRVRDGTVVAGYGPTLLIAAARCYVVSKLGEEVEVPEELT